MEDDLDALVGSEWFSTLDLNTSMRYHQVPMAEQDKQKTAFSTPREGFFQYSLMPFGLCNATFQQIIEKTLSGLQWKIAVLYLDGIVVFGENFEEHLANIENVFDRLAEMNLKVFFL